MCTISGRKDADLTAHGVDNAAVHDLLPGPARVELDSADGNAVDVLACIVCHGAPVVHVQDSTGHAVRHEPTAGVVKGNLGAACIVRREVVGDKEDAHHGG